MDARFASRKFILGAALLLYGMGCNAFGLPLDAQWMQFLTWVYGLYVTGNVGMYLVSKTADPKA
jgi:hypothetical protein